MKADAWVPISMKGGGGVSTMLTTCRKAQRTRVAFLRNKWEMIRDKQPIFRAQKMFPFHLIMKLNPASDWCIHTRTHTHTHTRARALPSTTIVTAWSTLRSPRRSSVRTRKLPSESAGYHAVGTAAVLSTPAEGTGLSWHLGGPQRSFLSFWHFNEVGWREGQASCFENICFVFRERERSLQLFSLSQKYVEGSGTSNSANKTAMFATNTCVA